MAADPYAYCETLTRDQWAWEFLRHNPDYQSDYRQFIALWRALEAEYGAPPHRDFVRWKQDPRAYGPLASAPSDALEHATGDLCIGDDDRVYIECWIGAKWGFHKFPLDPACVAPGPDELSWRPPPALETRPDGDPYRLDIAFDLSLPFPRNWKPPSFDWSAAPSNCGALDWPCRSRSPASARAGPGCCVCSTASLRQPPTAQTCWTKRGHWWQAATGNYCGWGTVVRHEGPRMLERAWLRRPFHGLI